MHKSQRLFSILLFLIIILGLIGLAKKSKPSSEGSITVGVIAPLTGVRADAGEYTVNAITIAKEEINNDPKRKYKLNFLIEDSKYEAPAAVSAIQKLITLNKVKYVIGPYGSSESLAVAPIA